MIRLYRLLSLLTCTTNTNTSNYTIFANLCSRGSCQRPTKRFYTLTLYWNALRVVYFTAPEGVTMIQRAHFVLESMGARELIPIPGNCLYIYGKANQNTSRNLWRHKHVRYAILWICDRFSRVPFFSISSFSKHATASTFLTQGQQR